MSDLLLALPLELWTPFDIFVNHAHAFLITSVNCKPSILLPIRPSYLVCETPTPKFVAFRTSFIICPLDSALLTSFVDELFQSPKRGSDDLSCRASVMLILDSFDVLYTCWPSRTNNTVICQHIPVDKVSSEFVPQSFMLQELRFLFLSTFYWHYQYTFFSKNFPRQLSSTVFSVPLWQGREILICQAFTQYCTFLCIY